MFVGQSHGRSVRRRSADCQLVVGLIIRRSSKADDERWFIERSRRNICDPANGMQRGEGVHQGLHIHSVDRPATTDPLPLVVRPADQALFVIGEKRQPVNLFRFELENRQFLPLQRIGKNMIECGAANRDDEWLLPSRAKNCRHRFFRMRSSRKDARPPVVSAVFSDANELRVTCQLRLIETIFRQVGRDVCRRNS